MGHQESLAVAGDKDVIAMLDGDWSVLPPDERTAFGYARKLTFEPHRIGRDDYVALRQHLTDLQAFELIFWLGSYNLTNRWTEALAIPLEEFRQFLTPAPPGFKDRPTRLAPIAAGDDRAARAAPLIAARPGLESRSEVEAALEQCRKRSAYLALESEQATLPLIPEWAWREAPGVFPASQKVPNWMLLLAHLPKAGGYKIQGMLGEAAKGKIDRRLAAQINWICARHDRAWYAVGQAKRRLLALGESPDAIYALDGDWKPFTPRAQTTFAFVRKLTVAPASITDEDVAGLRKLYNDSQVAEIVYRACSSAFFDRVTEACGLPLED